MMNFRDYIEYAEKQLTLAEESPTQSDIQFYLTASILFSWIAIESFVNNMVDDFNQVPAELFPMHEKAFLLEKKLRFNDKGQNVGKFIIDDYQNDYRRLEEKIFFLIAKFSNAGSIRGDTLWQIFEAFKDTRNKIAHPRKSDDFHIDCQFARKCLSVSQKIINLISENVWKKEVDF